MSGKPAARLSDPTTHGPPLVPGPPALTVFIGGQPAWKGVPSAVGTGLKAMQKASETALETAEKAAQTAEKAALAAAGTPGAPVAAAAAVTARTAAETAKASAATAVGAAITAAAGGGSSIHLCPVPWPVPPHGPGVIIDGSPTVSIEFLPATRQGDTCIEAIGPPDKIAMGHPTTLIGSSGPVGVSVVPAGFTGPLAPGQMTGADYYKALEVLDRIEKGNSKIQIEGTPEFKAQALDALARLMSRPTGRALVFDLDGAPKTTTIQSTDGGNAENADNWNDGLYDTANKKPGPGSNTVVTWNAQRNKIDGEDWETRDPAIGLGHELIHSHHDVHGTTDGRASVNYTGRDGNGHASPGYELQAVGLGPYAGNPLTEEKLRKEHDGTVSTEGRQEPDRPYY